MASDLNVLNLRSFRGGLNLTDPPAHIGEDQVLVAENVDLSEATLGASRLGVRRVEAETLVTYSINHLDRWFPSNTPEETILLSGNIFEFAGNAVLGFIILDGDVNTTLTGGDQTIHPVGSWPLVSSVSLHGKLFLAYKSAADRLHVLDPGETSIRRVGLAAPSGAPGVTNTGSGSYAAIERFYRTRITTQDSNGVTVARSEPSEVTAFTPSGSGAAARVSIAGDIPALEDETHWEVEASKDGVLFYRIATTVIGTTTYDDSADPDTYSDNPLSEDIGDYTLPWSAKYLAVDEDRLLFAGSYEDEALASRVGWTPVAKAPGVGNDERLELDTDPFLDLDGYEGGALTGLSQALNGYLYAFKESHVYRLVRTGNRARAYEAILVSKQVGAFPKSIVGAFDAEGNPAQYFWDPVRGPQRLSSAGIEDCGRDIRPITARVNIDAKLPVFGLYYPERKQVWYWVAVDGADFPNLKLVFQIRDGLRGSEGVRGGWVTHTGTAATGVCGCLYARNVGKDEPRERTLRPVIGYQRPTEFLAAFETPGSFEWEAPHSGNVIVLAIGGGGGVSDNAASVGRGGGGGGAAAYSVIPVTQGLSYTVTVGAGGTSVGSPGGDGGASSFETDVIAAGGGGVGSTSVGGTGGQASNSTGDITFDGGDGGDGNAGGGGGGGGSSAFLFASGTDGNDAAGATGGAATAATGSLPGLTPPRGNGGAGGNAGQPGEAGGSPGGGAGGEGAASTAPTGNGADGGVYISYASWIGIADEGDTDMGDTYSATITSKPFSPRGLLRKIGAMCATLLCRAGAGESVRLTLTRDYGLETAGPFDVDCAPSGTEDHVFRPLDDAKLSELRSLQVTLASTPDGEPWQVDQVAVQLRDEERQ